MPSYTIAEPDGVGQEGDYDQLHAIGYDRDDDRLLVLGRTFFEDNSTGDDYVTLVRARFDLVFADGLDRQAATGRAKAGATAHPRRYPRGTLRRTGSDIGVSGAGLRIEG